MHKNIFVDVVALNKSVVFAKREPLYLSTNALFHDWFFLLLVFPYALQLLRRNSKATSKTFTLKICIKHLTFNLQIIFYNLNLPCGNDHLFRGGSYPRLFCLCLLWHYLLVSPQHPFHRTSHFCLQR